MTIRIRPWREMPDPSAAEREIDRIFFASAGTTTFADDTARAAFRERWLGRYLVHDPQLALVAVDAAGAVVGYLVGSHNDPAKAPRFADIPYFVALAATTARYPAHLHINLAPESRGQGIGGRLVEAFVDDVRAAGLPGVHVVTGRGMRNVAFYGRLGFIERAAADYNRRAVVLLGRDVGKSADAITPPAGVGARS